MQKALPPLLTEALPEPTLGMRLAGALGGLACAALIFGGLALTRKPGTAAEEPEVFVARQLSVPLEAPPPPPPAPNEVQLDSLASPIQLEITASSSPVRIQVPDVPRLAVDFVPPVARPGVVARFDLAKSAVRPRLDTAEVEVRRVFEAREVDQRPVVLKRTPPRIGYSAAEQVATPRTTMLLVVNTDGSVGDVRLLKSAKDEDFDRIMMEAIREWKFSPAIRKGRRVRCWVQQSITVQLAEKSRFSAD